MTSKTEKDQSEIHKYIWEKQLQHPQDTPEDMCARLKEDETFMSIFGRDDVGLASAVRVVHVRDDFEDVREVRKREQAITEW